MSSNSTDINLISASIAITSSLVDSPRLKHFVSNFIYRDGYAETLASVASSDNDELVPGSIRQSAIHLFARLWKLADERRNEEEMVERLETGYFTPEAFFGTIAKGIDMVVDQRGSIELECISLWIERLQATEKVPRAPATNGKAELVEALRRAVPFSSFGMPVEDDRATISLSLLQLGEHIDEPTSDARLTAA
ncbi:hypothetical protein FRC02_001222 [Tulasnella sp. 418]|nr:hypothetical protein FRC02_001222 [Tulasnella sp. 418]